LRIAKKNFNEEHFSEAEAFVDAFSNGDFHEEEFSWGAVSDCLSRDQVVSLFLPVCHGLIRGSVDHREGESLEAIMRLYTNLIKWQQNHLKEPADILSSLDEVRPYVLSLASEGGWVEAKYFFQMLDYGVRRRMGLLTHPLDSAYSK
jgi:hypothetical protein